MSRRGPEGKIQDAVIKYARERYEALCKKNEVGRFFVGSGFPDYTIYASGGRVCLIEFKKPGAGSRLTDLQTHIKERLENLGHRYYKVDSINYGKIVIDQECS